MTETKKLHPIIKRLIVERLFIDGLDPADMVDDDVLVDSLGLDSMDFLEIAVGLEQEFGLTIVGNGIDRDTMRSVNTLAVFVQAELLKKENGA